MSCNVKNGDVGTVFELTVTDCENVAVDISGAVSLAISLKSPAGVVTEKTPTLTTDGTDGKMQYVTVLDDIDEVGKWQIQGAVELSTGKWSTSIGQFYVDNNL